MPNQPPQQTPGMNKAQATIWLIATVAAIALAALGAVTYILADDKPANDGQVAGILAWAGGLIASVLLIVRLQMGLHDAVNSRLDELLASRGREQHAAGVVQGQTTERAHPLTEQQQVTIVADSDHPVPVKPVE